MLDCSPTAPSSPRGIRRLDEPESHAPEIEARFLHLQQPGAGGAPAAAAGAAGADRGSPGHRLARRARRPRRRLHGHQAGGEAGDPGDDRLSPRAWTRSRGCWPSGIEVLRLSPGDRPADQGRARRAPARGAAARADGGDPAPARRRRRRQGRRRSPSSTEAIAKAGMPKEVEEQARKELRRLRAHAGSGRRVRHGPHLSRLADRAAVDAARGEADRHRRGARASSTRTITGSRRSSGASSNIWRCASSRRRARRRSCASSARPASARPRSASRSRAPWTASSCASASAACTTRRRSAATGAPISARCPATSSRRSARPARATA